MLTQLRQRVSLSVQISLCKVVKKSFWMSPKLSKTARMNVTDKIGVKTENPVNDFQVGDNQEFFIGLDNRDLVTVNGNIFTSNLSFASELELVNKFKVSNSDSNVLEVTGNTFTTNATVGSFFECR